MASWRAIDSPLSRPAQTACRILYQQGSMYDSRGGSGEGCVHRWATSLAKRKLQGDLCWPPRQLLRKWQSAMPSHRKSYNESRPKHDSHI